MNAIDLLEDDHDRLQSLVKELQEACRDNSKSIRQSFQRLRTELGLHELMEEEVLYPAFKRVKELKPEVLEGYEEHHVADMLLGELTETPFNNETWAPKLKVLKEQLEHHIEEEEGELFPNAKDYFSDNDLEQLGQQMAELRAEHLGEEKKAA
jgi:hemerythrin superfamily protein